VNDLRGTADILATSTACFIAQSIAAAKSSGESAQPCRTPILHSVYSQSGLGVALWPPKCDFGDFRGSLNYILSSGYHQSVGPYTRNLSDT